MPTLSTYRVLLPHRAIKIARETERQMTDNVDQALSDLYNHLPSDACRILRRINRKNRVSLIKVLRSKSKNADPQAQKILDHWEQVVNVHMFHPVILEWSGWNECEEARPAPRSQAQPSLPDTAMRRSA